MKNGYDLFEPWKKGQFSYDEIGIRFNALSLVHITAITKKIATI
jgi:hypothetical protein